MLQAVSTTLLHLKAHQADILFERLAISSILIKVGATSFICAKSLCQPALPEDWLAPGLSQQDPYSGKFAKTTPFSTLVL